MLSVKQPLSMQKQEANMMQQSIMWMQHTATRNLTQMVRFVISSCNCIGVNQAVLRLHNVHVVLYYPCDVRESAICGIFCV